MEIKGQRIEIRRQRMEIRRSKTKRLEEIDIEFRG